MATQIPEGHVLVPFGANPQQTAIALLKAAGDDGHSVLTVSEGFHVPEDIAAKFSKSYADKEFDVEEERITDIGAPVLSDPAAAEGAEFIANKNPDATALAAEGDVVVPEGDPTGDWKAAELDEYARQHSIQFDADTKTKAQKLEAISKAKG